jgi:rhodanese-related sulfurtransferase
MMNMSWSRSLTLTRSLVVGFAALAVVALGACGSDSNAESESDPTAATGDDLRTVDVATFANAIDGPDRVLIDVRTPEEHAEGHLADARLMDFYAPTFRADLDELDRDTPYAIYCRSGNRSGQALAIMRELGFTDVVDLDGGIGAWTAAGQPVDV